MTVKNAKSLGLSNETGATSSANNVFYLEPNTTNLGTVTSVSTSLGLVTYTIGTDAEFARTSFYEVEFFGLTLDAYNALLALSSGDTLYLGSWASFDGNPTYIIVDLVDGYWNPTYGGEIYVYKSAQGSNFQSDGPSAQVGATWSLEGTVTNVVTNNSNLALSQTYFEVGNLTPFVSANVTVSSGTITFPLDLSSSISAGMSVTEKNYTSTPSVKQYNLVTGAWDDYAQSSVWSSPTTLSATHVGNNNISIYSTNDYMWGITQIEIPSDWNDWVIEASGSCQISMSNATGSTVAYGEVRFITNPTSVGGNKLTISETNRNAFRYGSPQTYSYSLVPGSARTAGRSTFFSTTLIDYQPLVLNAIVNKPLLENWATSLESVTEVCVYAYLDPRFQQGVLYAASMDVTARRTG